MAAKLAKCGHSQSPQTARREQRQRQQSRAEQHHSVGVGDTQHFRQGDEQQRAERGSEQRAGAADDDDQHEIDVFQKSVGLRRGRAQELDLQAAAKTGNRRRKRKDRQFVGEHVDAAARRQRLVLTNGGKRPTEIGIDEGVLDNENQKKNRHGKEIEPGRPAWIDDCEAKIDRARTRHARKTRRRLRSASPDC